MKSKDMIVGIIFVFLLGSLFHFTYELSNNSALVSIFSATNNSVFEHCKLIIYPTIIWYLIYYLKNRKETNKNVLLSSLVVNIIVSILSIIFIFYTLNGFFGKTSLLTDILIFLISIIIGFNHSNKIQNIKMPLIILLIIIILFTYFTFNPLNIPFFDS